MHARPYLGKPKRYTIFSSAGVRPKIGEVVPDEACSMVRRLQSERYTVLANVSGRVLLATVIESERVSIESATGWHFFVIGFSLLYTLFSVCNYLYYYYAAIKILVTQIIGFYFINVFFS